VLNRVFSGYYPEDVCGVVYQNADHHLACQVACDGKRKAIGERGAWARANRIAKDALAGKAYEQAVGTATHYNAFYVHPNWVREMKKLARFGEHSFYRPFAWGNGSDEPAWSVLAVKKTAAATH
jgi:spore germination cell wall hydrolase CwlJ-like protein